MFTSFFPRHATTAFYHHQEDFQPAAPLDGSDTAFAYDFGRGDGAEIETDRRGSVWTGLRPAGKHRRWIVSWYYLHYLGQYLVAVLCCAGLSVSND